MSAGVTVTISGITIEDGATTPAAPPVRSSGGGIENAGTLTLTNSRDRQQRQRRLRSNCCGAAGGGIENEASGTLTVTDSTITGNSANGGCTGLRRRPAAASRTCGTLTVTDSTFSDNAATTGCDEFCAAAGGGLDNNGTATVTASTVSGNQADNSCTNNCGPNGGGIDNESAGTLNVENSTVADNQANSGCVAYCGAAGGGLDNVGTLTLDNSTLSANSVSGWLQPAIAGMRELISTRRAARPTLGATILANSSGATRLRLRHGCHRPGLQPRRRRHLRLHPGRLRLPRHPLRPRPGRAAEQRGTDRDHRPRTRERRPSTTWPPPFARPPTSGASPATPPVTSGPTTPTAARRRARLAIDAVIQVETSPSYAGDPVHISSSQLQASCGGTITFETLQGGRRGNATSGTNSISVILDDDGNATVVVEGQTAPRAPTWSRPT